MFDYNNMIQRAIKFFPTWSDIRKRYKTSNGGRLLSSATEEILDIEDAIKKYRECYFLSTYEGRENEMVAFTYMTRVGQLSSLVDVMVTYNKEELNYTNDIDKFLSNAGIDYFYYEDGIIYIREEKYIKDLDTIDIEIDNFTSTYNIEKFHVWNMYDEFACFVGLQRYNNETNIELYNRIMYTTKYKGNATVPGLRNAIIAELMTDFPELTNPEIAEQDIQIERVNPENLRQPYKDFNSLLDFLNSMNRDVYRWKRWDLDSWKYDFKSINYIPIQWDTAITRWQNGVGFGNDLSVELASNINSTNATLTLYKKSKEQMNKYLSNKNINKNITLSFKKNNVISSTTPVNYTIEASKLLEIDPLGVYIDIYNNDAVTETVPLEEIYGLGKGVKAISNNIIDNMYPYKLRFSPKNGKPIEIYRCNVNYYSLITNELIDTVNLLENKAGFSLNAYGALVSNNVKQTVDKTSNFNIDSTKGFKDSDNGLECTETNNYGVKTLYNLANKNITYNMDYGMDTIYSFQNKIKINSAKSQWIDNKTLQFSAEEGIKTIKFNLVANKFSFDVKTNNSLSVLIRYSETGNYDVIDTAQGMSTYTSQEFATPRYMEITLSTSSTVPTIISDIKYANTTVNFYYFKNNKYIQINDSKLPSSNNFDFKVEVINNTGANSYLKYLYFVNDLKIQSVYTTDSFRTNSNCYRKIDISCNCNAQLIKRNIYDTLDIDVIENYSPHDSYKAISDDSYIRLNLNDYTQINKITTDVGRIEYITESGVTYYNLALNNGDVATSITIDGVKDAPVYSISIVEMINRELQRKEMNKIFNPAIDKLYCSRLCNGVIVSINRIPIFLQLGSDLLYKTSVTKYEIKDLPDNVNVIWGTNNGVYGETTTSSFNYISFYPVNEKVHVANNTFDVIGNEMHGIKVLETFSDINTYNPKSLNFYSVKSNTEGADVRFYDEIEYDIDGVEGLSKWSIGLKDIYINLDTTLQDVDYKTNVIDYSIDIDLKEEVAIKDTYIIDNTKIKTEDYILESPKGTTIKYLTYDGTSNTENLVKTESYSIASEKYIKLNCSNIDKIMYIGTRKYQPGIESDITNYTILKEEGILILPPGLSYYTLNIKYTIKKPVGIVFDIDLLYKLTNYTIETYREIVSYTFLNMMDNSTYDISQLKEYKDSSLVYIECSEPSFQGKLINDYTVQFNKTSKENTLLIKTGYYYINGKEYYLFSQDDSKEIKNNTFINYKNVDVNDEYLHTYKPCNNHVKNSEMLLRAVNDLYKLDTNSIDKNEIKFNKYTSCESYNDWTSFNMNISITNEYSDIRLITNNESYLGFNDGCLKFTKKDKNISSYAYIDITDLIHTDNIVSVAATKDIDIYICKEIIYNDTSVHRHTIMRPLVWLTTNTTEDSSIRTCNFRAEEEIRYYFVVAGEGAIDDIIITDTLNDNVKYHVKTIENFGLFLEEVKNQGDIYKIKINDNKGTEYHGVSLCSDHNFRIMGNVDWNMTLIQKYNCYEDFDNRNCYKDTELITDSFLHAPKNSSARFITEATLIQPDIVNRIVYKINDVLLDSYNGVNVTIHTSNNSNFDNELTYDFNRNYGSLTGNNLLKYVKFELDIPEDTIVNNIEVYVEYRQTKDNAPILSVPDVGYMITPIYDAQKAMNYTIRNININDISSLQDIEIYVRTMNDNNTSNVWSDWEKLDLVKSKYKQYKVDEIVSRYFQFKVKMLSKSAYLDLDSIDIEVIK